MPAVSNHHVARRCLPPIVTVSRIPTTPCCATTRAFALSGSVTFVLRLARSRCFLACTGSTHGLPLHWLNTPIAGSTVHAPLLDGLPARARAAFLLSQLEGLAYADIAQRLGVSVSMVKKYMLQAMAHCMGVGRP